MNTPIKYTFTPTSAKVLGFEADGNPVFSRNSWGSGQVFFLSVPIERYLSRTPGGFTTKNALPFWKIYSYFASVEIEHRAVRKANILVGVTEHILDEKHRVVVLVNYSPQGQKAGLQFAQAWKIDEIWYGSYLENNQFVIPANDALVFTISC